MRSPFFAAILCALAAIPTAAAETLALGGVTITIPKGSDIRKGSSSGIDSASLDLGARGRYYITSYGWWSLLNLHSPKTADEYLNLAKHVGAVDVESLKQGEFHGCRAWTRTRRFSEGMPTRGIPMADYQERVVVVQRRQGFFVVKFVSPLSVYDEDLPLFESFLERIQIGPSFPVGPRALLVMLIVVALGLGGGLARYRLLRRSTAK